MTETFPRQQARTRQYTLGLPRSFQISPDGGRVAFLRSRGSGDPVTCLWVLDSVTGIEHLVADQMTVGFRNSSLGRLVIVTGEFAFFHAAGTDEADHPIFVFEDEAGADRVGDHG